jgi:hypothetical protein
MSYFREPAPLPPSLIFEKSDNYVPSVFGRRTILPPVPPKDFDTKQDALDCIAAYKKKSQTTKDITLSDFFISEIEKLKVKDDSTKQTIKTYSTLEIRSELNKLKNKLSKQFNWEAESQYQLLSQVLVERGQMTRDEIETFEEIKSIEKKIEANHALLDQLLIKDPNVDVGCKQTQVQSLDELNRNWQDRMAKLSARLTTTDKNYFVIVQLLEESIRDAIKLNDLKAKKHEIFLSIKLLENRCKLLATNDAQKSIIKQHKFDEDFTSLYQNRLKLQIQNDSSVRFVVNSNSNFLLVDLMKQRFPNLFVHWFDLYNQYHGGGLIKSEVEARLKQFDEDEFRLIAKLINDNNDLNRIYLVHDLRISYMISNSQKVTISDGNDNGDYGENEWVRILRKDKNKEISIFSVAWEIDLITSFSNVKLYST